MNGDTSKLMTRPVGRVLPRPVRRMVRRSLVVARHRGLRPEDVLLVCYPKSGSTWLRFVVAQALMAQEIDFDSVGRVSPRLGEQRGAPELFGPGRLVKSHEPWSKITRTPTRAIYLVRDGRDVAVSMYFFVQRRGAFAGTFSEFLDLFLAGEVNNSGSWARHVAGWVRARDASPDRVSLLKYEDMLLHGAAAVRAAFGRIGVVIDDDALTLALERNSAGAMRSKESRSETIGKRQGKSAEAKAIPFVRVGRSGKWVETFDEEQERRFSRAAGDVLVAAGYLQ
ncbi:MAG: sulfotransferase domain-containing protein [Gemmatimonadota bacterium]|nr:sulfotransferase domain-containing protein [Gemmatimonadota bacterium]